MARAPMDDLDRRELAALRRMVKHQDALLIAYRLQKRQPSAGTLEGIAKAREELAAIEKERAGA